MTTHVKSLTKLSDAALTLVATLVKFGSDADHVAANGATDKPFGVVEDTPSAAEEHIAVKLLSPTDETISMVASEAITAGEDVYTAAAGKVQDLPVAAGTYYKVGTALEAAAADGDLIEVAPCEPVATVVTE